MRSCVKAQLFNLVYGQFYNVTRTVDYQMNFHFKRSRDINKDNRKTILFKMHARLFLTQLVNLYTVYMHYFNKNKINGSFRNQSTENTGGDGCIEAFK